jgi:hypothetical protein
MISDRHALAELLASIECIIASKEGRLLTVTSDAARTQLIDDIAGLQVRPRQVLAALIGKADPLLGQ